MQGTAEEHFAGIAAAAHAEALIDIEDILTAMIVLTTRRQNDNLWNHKYRYRITFSKFQTLTKQTIAHPEVLQTAPWIL